MFIGMLGTWIRGLLAIAILVGGVLFLKEWVEELPRTAEVIDPLTSNVVVRPLTTLGERIEAWDPEPNRSTGLLVAGVALLLLGMMGRFVSPWLWRKRGKARDGASPRRVHALQTRNGYRLNVDEYGPEDAPPLILVHGVGSDRTQWRETIEDLADRFRIYAVDLLGHGNSDHVDGAEHTLEAAARDLDDVIALAGEDHLVLVGHSMGGMIAMTWCSKHRTRAERLAGLVLVHTTPQNPFTTMDPVGFHTALQKPIHEPILRITPALAPFVRLMNLLEYLNGTAHWNNDMTLFGGTETREQLDRTARLMVAMDPAAVARFTLSMARFDVRKVLPKLDVPTLVVAAEQDGTTRPEASRAIAELVPAARLVTLDKTKHMGFVERRLPFAAAIASLRRDGEAKRARHGTG